MKNYSLIWPTSISLILAITREIYLFTGISFLIIFICLCETTAFIYTHLHLPVFMPLILRSYSPPYIICVCILTLSLFLLRRLFSLLSAYKRDISPRVWINQSWVEFNFKVKLEELRVLGKYHGIRSLGNVWNDATIRRDTFFHIVAIHSQQLVLNSHRFRGTCSPGNEKSIAALRLSRSKVDARG